MTGNKKSQSGKEDCGKACGFSRSQQKKTSRLIEETALLGEKTQRETNSHGNQTYLPQLLGRHFQNLPEPSLHGFGRSNIRQPFEDQNKPYQRNQKFHG